MPGKKKQSPALAAGPTKAKPKEDHEGRLQNDSDETDPAEEAALDAYVEEKRAAYEQSEAAKEEFELATEGPEVELSTAQLARFSRRAMQK